MLIREPAAMITVYDFTGSFYISIEDVSKGLHLFMIDRGYSESCDMFRMNKVFQYEILVFFE